MKKMITKARLQRPFENQILTPQDMYRFCKENFGEKVSFLYTSSEEIGENEKFLATRFQNSLLIPGTQKLHKIIPAGNGKVKIYETSHADEGEERITQKNSKKDLLHPNSGDYVICKYNDKFGWYLSALAMKSLMILKLNCCIQVDTINIIALLK